MAKALMCDRCGKLYKKYNTGTTSGPNGIRFFQRDMDDTIVYAGCSLMDLCEDCLKSAKNWFNEIKHINK